MWSTFCIVFIIKIRFFSVDMLKKLQNPLSEKRGFFAYIKIYIGIFYFIYIRHFTFTELRLFILYIIGQQTHITIFLTRFPVFLRFS